MYPLLCAPLLCFLDLQSHICLYTLVQCALFAPTKLFWHMSHFYHITGMIPQVTSFCPRTVPVLYQMQKVLNYINIVRFILVELSHFCLCWLGLSVQMYSFIFLCFIKSRAVVACSMNIIHVIAVRAQFSFVALDDEVTPHSMHCGIVI